VSGEKYDCCGAGAGWGRHSWRRGGGGRARGLRNVPSGRDLRVAGEKDESESDMSEPTSGRCTKEVLAIRKVVGKERVDSSEDRGLLSAEVEDGSQKDQTPEGVDTSSQQVGCLQISKIEPWRRVLRVGVMILRFTTGFALRGSAGTLESCAGACAVDSKRKGVSPRMASSFRVVRTRRAREECERVFVVGGRTEEVVALAAMNDFCERCQNYVR
jgi:hypothetical protein